MVGTASGIELIKDIVKESVVAEYGRLAQLERVVQRFAELTIAHKGEVKVIVTSVINYFLQFYAATALRTGCSQQTADSMAPKLYDLEGHLNLNASKQSLFPSSECGILVTNQTVATSSALGMPFLHMDELLKRDTFATHAVAAAGSVALSTALSYPLDTLKVLMQVGSSSRKQLSMAQVLDRVRAISGYSGLYSGIGWLMTGRALGLGVRFGVYEILTAFYKDGREDNYVHVSEALMAGLAAGSVESLVSSPFELIKLRAQVASASRIPRPPSLVETTVVPPLIARLLPGYSLDMRTMSNSVGLLSTLTTMHAKTIDALKEYPWMMTGSGRPPPVSNVRRPSDVITLEGWGALWRGLRPGLVRDSIFGGIFFSSWQFLHGAMLEWKAVGMDPIPRFDEEIGPLSPVAVSLVAGVSGSIAAAASQSFDTAKSRSQCVVLPKFVSMERKFLKWNRQGKRFERLTGIHPADRNLLMNGVWLRMARSGLASFVVVGSYFLAVDHLVAQ
ncbi:Mitochondrial substrate carrier family protein [Forsythia ovata]|uniref:Mitochondrial substrate carrier family protein n=1 Tax=Forsythia ovata TaxID=205694 RepID=A0ABD1U4D6_9LAMI